MQQHVCSLFPFLSMGQILQLFSMVGSGEGFHWCFVCVMPLVLIPRVWWMGTRVWCLALRDILSHLGPSGAAKMPTRMTSEIKEAFQYAFILHFANTSSF